MFVVVFGSGDMNIMMILHFTCTWLWAVGVYMYGRIACAWESMICAVSCIYAMTFGIFSSIYLAFFQVYIWHFFKYIFGIFSSVYMEATYMYMFMVCVRPFFFRLFFRPFI